ncbi:toprim domain-containing protein [Virgibacillus ihumii]|uniref:toprim domain-containing protein n=1 Tax=Virgibacillus ihumii TaxID=2686091 RepID=UPI00157CA950|nr:toprim domain-containing protein [Virgibacillus ihumii]
MKQNAYKKLVFQNIENALDELNAEDKGHYFICNCPECHEHEAFMYKNNQRFIQCNRENHCGSRMMLEFHEKGNMSAYEEQMEKTYPNLTPEQRQALNWSARVFSFAKTGLKSKSLDNGYRGLSTKVSRSFIADLQREKVVQHLFQKAEPLLGKDYSHNSWMCKRNLVFPLYGEDDTLDRVLLRSSMDETIEPKEIQLILNPSKETRDFFMDIPDHAETVVISESILDALSFREVDENVGFIALTGASKTRKVKEHIHDNTNQWCDKHVIVAMDDDKAGWKATQDIVSALDQKGIDWSVFDYTGDCKDANENLQDNRKAFEKAYYQLSTHMKAKEINAALKQEKERVFSVEYEP